MTNEYQTCCWNILLSVIRFSVFVRTTDQHATSMINRVSGSTFGLLWNISCQICKTLQKRKEIHGYPREWPQIYILGQFDKFFQNNEEILKEIKH